MDDLFSSPVLRVDQPRGVPGAQSRYRVRDGHGRLLATAGERDVSRLRRAARTAGGGGGGGRTVHVENAQGVPLISVAAGVAASGAHVSTADGALIGALRKVGEKAGHQYMLQDSAARPVGQLDGSRYGYKFPVIDGYGNHVAQVDKKFKGVATELLTTADKYAVEIFQPLPDPLRVLVVAAPIAIDLMLYEGKDWPIG